MTLKELERAALAMFAAREAGERGSLEMMRAIAICMRNRVHQGWQGGDWLTVIELADQFAAHPPGPLVRLDSNSRNLQRLVRDIDEIYYSRSAKESTDMAARGGEMAVSLEKCVFWAFSNQPYTAFFQETVLDDPSNHPMRSHMGTMMFFE